MKQAVIKNPGVLDYSGTEALNAICSNLSFVKRDVRKVVVTSCTPGEGKSFCVMQIAQNLAKRGRSVVVVDADLRRSFMLTRFGIETEGEWTGLAHYLAGYCDGEDALYATNIEGLYLIPAGWDVFNPIPLLDTQYFTDMMNALAQRFDVVLVDAPPVGLVIDAAEIARSCDGSILVVEHNKTRRRELMEARDQMLKADCPILGCIINKVTFDSISTKKYYNKSYYGHYNSEYYRKSKQGRK